MIDPLILLNGFLFIILADLSICDLRSYRIPNEDNLLILFLGLLRLSLCNAEEFFPQLMGLFILSLPLFFLAWVRKGTLGGGDIKLIAAGGLYLGASAILYAAFIGFSLAGLFSIVMLLSKKKGPGDHIPMGPFLAVGMMACLLL